MVGYKELLYKNTGIKMRPDLQLFAEGGGGDKTERATPKKRQDARKKGQVFQSREITSALVLLFVFVAIRIFGGFIYNQLGVFTKSIFEEYANVDDLFTLDTLINFFVNIVTVMAKMLAPVFAVAVIAGLAAGYAQVGFLFTTETLSFKFNRINPLNGLKRIFSLRSVTELAKAVFKILVIGYVSYLYIKGESNNVMNLMDMDVSAIGAYIAKVIVDVAIRICVVLIILGIFDYAYQWWQYEKDLKMTKQEIKEEYKQTEGNPEVKSKIKQKQRQMSMRRMLHDVPKADVVITNPTHYAVAVKYDAAVSDAPMVVAKGLDYIAIRIREVAKENKVEVVENRPLARTLYENVEVGESIPPQLYQAVAEVLAFVYSLRKERR